MLLWTLVYRYLLKWCFKILTTQYLFFHKSHLWPIAMQAQTLYKSQRDPSWSLFCLPLPPSHELLTHCASVAWFSSLEQFEFIPVLCMYSCLFLEWAFLALLTADLSLNAIFSGRPPRSPSLKSSSSFCRALTQHPLYFLNGVYHIQYLFTDYPLIHLRGGWKLCLSWDF